MTPSEPGTGPSAGHGGGTGTGHGGETGTGPSTGHGGETEDSSRGTSAAHVTAKASGGKTS